MPLSQASRELTLQAIHAAKLPEKFLTQVERYYFPLAEYIDTKARQQDKALLLSLQGPQGAGKSTLCAFLKLILETNFKHSVAVLSLDDFYFNSATRQQLGRETHPLLKTRGVPGTHDLALARRTLLALKGNKPVKLPRFNKADDNPEPEKNWPVSSTDTSIILFEGWCNHVPVQSAAELAIAINDLEREEDMDGQWRTYVNQQLAIYHEQLFSLADMLLYIKIPDFQLVYDWRGLQEEKLKQSDSSGKAIMDERELRHFIQHFERLTRHGMQHLPDLADACLHLNKAHEITALDIAEQ